MKVINGRLIAKSILDGIANTKHLVKPTLAIVQVGVRSDSAVYIKMKEKAANKLSFDCQVHNFDETIDQNHLIQHIQRFNNDTSIHGIIIQLPLPQKFDAIEILNSVSSKKDVDGLTRENIGRLSSRIGTPLFVPCTARGILHLIKSTSVDLKGAHCTVVGISDLVGRPIGQLLLREGATVTFCHSKTKDLPSAVRLADVLVVAIGVPEFVRGEWLKEDAVVIDVGCNSIKNQDGYKYIGDIHYTSACERASYITPVPGGVGPLTVAMLMQNLSDAANNVTI